MIIQVAQDADFLNALWNHPAVREDAGLGEGQLDLSPVIKNHLALIGEFGATCYFKMDAGLWRVHTAVLPEGRGKWAREFAAASVHWMFTQTDACKIVTRVPHGHIGAKALTLATGFRFQFDTVPEVKFRGQIVGSGIYRLDIEDWVLHAAGLEENGAAFHDWMNQQISSGQPHGPDLVHNRIVGAALEMIVSGRPHKAVALFNWWSLACEHAPVVLANENPVQIKFDAGVLVYDGNFRIEPLH